MYFISYLYTINRNQEQKSLSRMRKSAYLSIEDPITLIKQALDPSHKWFTLLMWLHFTMSATCVLGTHLFLMMFLICCHFHKVSYVKFIVWNSILVYYFYVQIFLVKISTRNGSDRFQSHLQLSTSEATPPPPWQNPGSVTGSWHTLWTFRSIVFWHISIIKWYPA